MKSLSKEQQVMERRYRIPYNWCVEPHARMWRQKNGLWTVISEALAILPATSRVLDLGCGDGWYTAKMVEQGFSVDAVDYSKQAVAFATLLVPHARIQVASALALPFEDESFNVVVSIQVLEHLVPNDVPKALQEIARVLAPGGRAIISVPSVLRPLSTAHYQHFTELSFASNLPPSLSVIQCVGQERYDVALRCIERLLENRLWLLPRLAAWFHRNIYLRWWNKSAAAKGNNLVFTLLKSRV